jgi:hypothetical protein
MEAERHLSVHEEVMNAIEATPHRKLAAALMAGCVDVLKVPRPKSRQAVVSWNRARRDEIAFITEPRASAFWCEAAGVDYDAVLSRLKKLDLLTATAA